MLTPSNRARAERTACKAHTTDGVSDAERSLLRRSVRDFLSSIWPADRAVENSGDAEAMARLWPAMARQGLASLGSNAAEVGLREIVLVFEELGRASCPAPLLGAVAANLALAAQPSNSARALLEDLHQGNATIALALGAFDGDPAAGMSPCAATRCTERCRLSKARKRRRIS